MDTNISIESTELVIGRTETNIQFTKEQLENLSDEDFNENLESMTYWYDKSQNIADDEPENLPQATVYCSGTIVVRTSSIEQHMQRVDEVFERLVAIDALETIPNYDYNLDKIAVYKEDSSLPLILEM